MSVNVDLSTLKSFLGEEYATAIDKSIASHTRLMTRTGAGPEWLGWLDLLEQPNDALIQDVADLGRTIHQSADVLVVIGIGGSYLGAKAVVDALVSPFNRQGPEILFAGHHMGDHYHRELLKYLSAPKADGNKKSVYLNIISKSGTTLEPALAFRMLKAWMKQTYGDESKNRIIATTSPKGGALNKIIDAEGYRKFEIPDSVGGRFSVLTPVGLLPIAAAGIDIQALFYGAVSELESLKKDPAALIDHAACRYTLFKQGFAIDLISSFEPELGSFGGWMQQLMGESEGKGHKGLFPAVLRFSTDLHSLGQMVQDGVRNQMETFIAVKHVSNPFVVKPDAGNEDGLNYLAGRTVHEINTKALEGTRQAHLEGGVPALTLTIDTLDAHHVGALILYFEVLTGVYVYCLDENPFDQPGVEEYKKAMFRLLGKP
jgi:glucose-6-phosphate isomerase